MTQGAGRIQDVRLEPSWLKHLAGEFDQSYMQELGQFLRREKAAGKQIHPAGSELFNAFLLTPLESVKVVILGQDPYHGPRQAHGLCFSVRPGALIPPSLRNIFLEIENELGIAPPRHGDLSHWARQGVLLLNCVLSVQAGAPASHRGKGWERFTDRVIELVNARSNGVVFMLWGAYAQRKRPMVDENRHCVLTAPHPSPLSAHRGFFGCGHFRAASEYLRSRGMDPIDWSLPAG